MAILIPAVSRQHPVLASIASRSFFLSGELLLGNLSETVVVVGNAPHDRPGFLVGHLIGDRASFLWTKAPMPRITLFVGFGFSDDRGLVVLIVLVVLVVPL